MKKKTHVIGGDIVGLGVNADNIKYGNVLKNTELNTHLITLCAVPFLSFSSRRHSSLLLYD